MRRPLIRYVTTARLPTEKAHGIQIMSMCESFSKITHTELTIPQRRINIPTQAIFSYYGIPPSFEIKKLPATDITRFGILGPIPFLLLQRTFAQSTWKAHATLPHTEPTLYYIRDNYVFKVLTQKNLPTVIELHTTPPHVARFMKALSRCVAIVVISKTIKQELIAAGIPEQKIIYAPDGVKLEQFTTTTTRLEARTVLNIHPHTEMILYTGQLFPWKGVDTLIEAARYLPKGKEIFIVGGGAGREAELKAYANRLKLPVHFMGQVPHKDIPLYLTAADCVVIPTSAKERIGSHYTSPLKLFEALSMGKTIIASDLPSLREILDETCASFFIPDNPSSLATSIINTLNDSQKNAALQKNAKERAQNYSWDARAQHILEEITKLLDQYP